MCVFPHLQLSKGGLQQHRREEGGFDLGYHDEEDDSEKAKLKDMRCDSWNVYFIKSFNIGDSSDCNISIYFYFFTREKHSCALKIKFIIE